MRACGLAAPNAVAAAHNDPDAFDDAIGAWRRAGGTGQVVDRGREPLQHGRRPRAARRRLPSWPARHDAVLLIDEAHATGVFGPEGAGSPPHMTGAENVITLRTCGKALGCEGALVCGPRVVRDFLVNRGRGFIFSTAPSPLDGRGGARARSGCWSRSRSDATGCRR